MLCWSKKVWELFNAIILPRAGAFCILQRSRCFCFSSCILLRDLIYKGKVFFNILISRVYRMELKQVTVNLPCNLFFSIDDACIMHFLSLLFHFSYLNWFFMWKIMSSNMQKNWALPFEWSVTSGSWKIASSVLECFWKTYTFPFTARFWKWLKHFNVLEWKEHWWFTQRAWMKWAPLVKFLPLYIKNVSSGRRSLLVYNLWSFHFSFPYFVF